MKLATLADGSRDGHLAVVDAALAAAHHAPLGASRLQQVLDDWNFLSPQLQDLCATLAGGKPRHALPFDPQACLAPLPRPYRCVVVGSRPDGRTEAVDVPGWFGPPRVRLAVPPHGATLQAFPHLALLTGDLPVGADPGRAGDAVRLVALAARVALAVGASTAAEPGADPAAVDPSAPAPQDGTAEGVPPGHGRWLFAPAALTPDELRAEAWRDLQWRVDGLSAGRTRRPASAARWPHPAGPVIASALAAAAALAPLPAGSVVLWPLPAGRHGAVLGSGSRVVLRAVDGEGGEPFGAITVDGLGDGPSPAR